MDEKLLKTEPSVGRKPSASDLDDDTSASAEPDLSGTSLDGYKLLRQVAEGGMGVVYEALQVKLDRKVALKVLTEELGVRKEFLQRFEREAKAAAALNHINVVQVHDFGEAHGRYYIVMEYVEGDNLSDYVEKNGQLPVSTALDVIEQAVQGLKTACAKSIIHRDIKPSNLMLTPEGQVKVADLGLAKNLSKQSDMTMTGIGMGSPYFIAPEQAQDARHVDHRADIYSLGITLLFLLTGKRPFDGKTPLSIVLAHTDDPLPSDAQLGTVLPKEVDALLLRMAAKKPEERYPDYDSLLADLQRVKSGQQPTFPAPGSRERRRKMLMAGAIVAIVAMAGAIAWWRIRK